MGLRSIIIITVSFLTLDLIAQKRDFQEEVHLSLNTTNILVGEVLHFSAFVYSNSTKHLSELSSLLYIELIDEEGTPIHQIKIGLRKGRGSGSIKINPEWMSSTYRIVAYTKWMRNYGSFFEQKLLVLNPYTRLTNNYEISGDPIKIEEPHQKGETFGPLQNISMDMGAIEPATLSISVYEKPDLGYPNELSLENPLVTIDAFNILPDYKYALVQGRIKEATENSGKQRINMTVKGESLQVATSQTDELGRFWMNYNPDIALNDAAVQIQGEDAAVEFEIIDEFYEQYSKLNSGNTILDSVLLSGVIARSIHSQIQSAYLVPEKQDITARNVYSSKKDAVVYYLDDYKRFSSVRDTFIELTIHVGAAKSEESDNLFVRCEQPPGLTATNRSPLILLDGLRVDARTLLDYDPNKIEKIEVIPAYYFVGDLVYKGVISAHTFGGSGNTSSSGYTFPIAKYQPYSGKAYRLTTADNLPHYESHVFWDPIHAHQGGPLILDFTTSRLEGIYQVSITGITKSGKPVNMTKFFQVSDVSQ